MTFMLLSCGIPLDKTASPAPKKISSTTGADGYDITTFQLINNDALTLYYKFVSTGTFIEEDFSKIPSNTTKSFLENEKYYLANDDDIYIWTDTGATNNPISVELINKSASDGVQITIKDNSGATLLNTKTVIRNSKQVDSQNESFKSPIKKNKDTQHLNSSNIADIAWIAVGYEFDATTFQFYSSQPTFITRMQNVSIIN